MCSAVSETLFLRLVIRSSFDIGAAQGRSFTADLCRDRAARNVRSREGFSARPVSQIATPGTNRPVPSLKVGAFWLHARGASARYASCCSARGRGEEKVTAEAVKNGDMNGVSFEAARLALAHLQFDGAAARQVALERAARICSVALGVERVGVWLLENGGRELVCPGIFVRADDSCRSESALDLTGASAYRRALETRKVIVANDAQGDSATREFAEIYLKPHGITSTLDASVFRDGEVVGVVCLEHVGAMRTWSDAENAFAASVADLVGLVLEQTARRQAEAELRDRVADEADLHRHALLGQVTASIAHDFANVMLGVGLAAEALPGSSDEERGGLHDDLGRWSRIGMDLVQRLREFSVAERKAAYCDATHVLTQLETMLALLCKRRAELRVDHAPGPVWVAISRTDMERVLFNLVLNARDAIEPVGQIGVALRVLPETLAIDVCDDGKGLSKELIGQVFEPYFTTKALGTGLGLATVRSIIDAAGGQVEVSSRPGQRTCFTVSIPRVEPLSVEPAAAHAEATTKGV